MPSDLPVDFKRKFFYEQLSNVKKELSSIRIRLNAIKTICSSKEQDKIDAFVSNLALMLKQIEEEIENNEKEVVKWIS